MDHRTVPNSVLQLTILFHPVNLIFFVVKFNCACTFRNCTHLTFNQSFLLYLYIVAMSFFPIEGSSFSDALISCTESSSTNLPNFTT